MHVFIFAFTFIILTIRHFHPYFDAYVSNSVGVIHSDIHDENLILLNDDDRTFDGKNDVENQYAQRKSEAWSQETSENNGQSKTSDSSWKQLNKPTSITTTVEECILDNGSVKLQFGIIDFADIMYTCGVFELAASVAYAMMQEATNGDAYINRGRRVIQGFLSVFQLSDLEKRVLFVCVCCRYCIELIYGQVDTLLQGDKATHDLNPCEKDGWEQLSKLIDLGPSKVYEFWFNSVNR